MKGRIQNIWEKLLRTLFSSMRSSSKGNQSALRHKYPQGKFVTLEHKWAHEDENSIRKTYDVCRCLLKYIAEIETITLYV